MTDINDFVAEYERNEKNQADLDDSRFGEIYLDDKMENYED